jgi:hypothetical protein
MPHSLRAKLSGLRYKGILEDKDYKRLCEALDNEDVLEQIQAEIYETFMTIDGGVHDKSALKCMEIIDKYR